MIGTWRWGEYRMPNPQAENGHIDIANQIAEALYKTNLSAYESRLLWFIFRKTYGWHKKKDRISYSQFAETGIARRHTQRTIKQLKGRNIINVTASGQKIEYSFQKDYTKWDTGIEGRAHSTVTNRGYSANRNLKGGELAPIGVTKLAPIGVNTKEKKETNKRKGRKEISPSSQLNKQVREVFAALKERRGYNNPNRSAEASAIHWMLRQGYTPSEITGCYDHLKQQTFWRDKALPMMSVQKQIGEWRKHNQAGRDEKWRVR
jgi:phage replication O-like protein O